MLWCLIQCCSHFSTLSTNTSVHIATPFVNILHGNPVNPEPKHLCCNTMTLANTAFSCIRLYTIQCSPQHIYKWSCYVYRGVCRYCTKEAAALYTCDIKSILVINKTASEESVTSKQRSATGLSTEGLLGRHTAWKSSHRCQSQALYCNTMTLAKHSFCMYKALHNPVSSPAYLRHVGPTTLQETFSFDVGMGGVLDVDTSSTQAMPSHHDLYSAWGESCNPHAWYMHTYETCMHMHSTCMHMCLVMPPAIEPTTHSLVYTEYRLGARDSWWNNDKRRGQWSMVNHHSQSTPLTHPLDIHNTAYLIWGHAKDY